VRPFDPPLPERDFLGWHPPPLPPHPPGLHPVGGGRRGRPAGALGVLRTAAALPAAWAPILSVCSGVVGYGPMAFRMSILLTHPWSRSQTTRNGGQNGHPLMRKW
jgi:hypothetical protein